MRWRCSVEGTIPSSNHAYRIVRMKTKTGKVFNTMAKTKTAAAWQNQAAATIRAAIPPDWVYDGGYIRIYYEFWLRRDMDVSDNAQKILNDAVESALGVNDRYFLTCVRDKHVGRTELPHVDIEVEYPYGA